MEKFQIIKKHLGVLDNKSSSSTPGLYNEVISKNFELIESFLKKFNIIYGKQQKLETHIQIMSQKIKKIESDTSNIHHEFRSITSLVQKKINLMKNQYRNRNSSVNSATIQRMIKRHKSKPRKRDTRVSMNQLIHQRIHAKKSNFAREGQDQNNQTVYQKNNSSSQSEQQSNDPKHPISNKNYSNFNNINETNKSINISQIDLKNNQYLKNIINEMQERILTRQTQIDKMLQFIKIDIKEHLQCSDKKIQKLEESFIKLQQKTFNKLQTFEKQIVNKIQIIINGHLNVTKIQLRALYRADLQNSLSQIRQNWYKQSQRLNNVIENIQDNKIIIKKMCISMEQLQERNIQAQYDKKQMYQNRLETKNAILFLEVKINNFIENQTKEIQKIKKLKENKDNITQDRFYNKLTMKCLACNTPVQSPQQQKINSQFKEYQKQDYNKTQQYNNISIFTPDFNKINPKLTNNRSYCDEFKLKKSNSSNDFTQKKHTVHVQDVMTLEVWKKKANNILIKTSNKKMKC